MGKIAVQDIDVTDVSGSLNRRRSPSDLLDGFAVCASTVCMIHCLVLPLVLAALPAFAARFDPGESFHRIVLAIAVPTSAMALFGGWRVHRAAGPAIAGVAGLSLMTLGALVAPSPATETLLTVIGSLSLAAAHVANWRRRPHASGRSAAVACADRG